MKQELKFNVFYEENKDIEDILIETIINILKERGLQFG